MCPPLQIPVDREEQFSLGTVVCSQENLEDSLWEENLSARNCNSLPVALDWIVFLMSSLLASSSIYS